MFERRDARQVERTCVVSAIHLPVSGPASLECSTVAGTPTLILWRAAGVSSCLAMCEVRW